MELLERLGVEVDFPVDADLLRPDAHQHRLPAGGGAAGPPVRRDLRRATTPWSRRRRRAPGRSVHYHHKIAAERGDAALRDGVARVAPKTYELTAVPHRRARQVRTSARTSRTGSPTTRPATRCARSALGDRPYRLLRAVRGLTLVDLPERGGVLRLRRHVRDQERRRVGGDGRGQGPARAGDRRRGAGGRGQLLPDPHRRAARPRAVRGAHAAHRRGAGLHRARRGHDRTPTSQPSRRSGTAGPSRRCRAGGDAP